jgi:uncharacterized protein (DUF885 family)
MPASQTSSKRWLDGWMRLNPVSATQLGDHRFDTEVDDLSPDGRQKAIAFSTQLLADLDAMDTGTLTRENQVDASILRNQLRSDIWNLQTFQGWAWDPQVYSGLAGGAIYNLMARDFAPLPDRLKTATRAWRRFLRSSPRCAQTSIRRACRASTPRLSPNRTPAS